MNDMKDAPVRGTIGQRIARKEDGRLLTGRGVFVDDVDVPGTLQVAFVRSQVARGRIRSIDTSVARMQPGVFAIYTGADIAPFKANLISFFLAPPAQPIPPVAVDVVKYVGDPVAVVIATDRYLAEDAASLVTVEYDEEDPVVRIDDARHGDPVHAGMDDNVAQSMGIDEDEDLEAVLTGAAHLVTHSVRHARVSQSPMETRGILVSPHGQGELTVYVTCQSPQMAVRYISVALGIPQSCVRVISKDVGGSFGLKVQPWREEIAVICCARLCGRPLKWIEDRYENLTTACQAREQEITLRTAFDAEGQLVASHHNYSVNNGAYPHGPDCNVAVSVFMWPAYRMPQFGFYNTAYFTNTVGMAAYRGPWAMESLVRETMLDVAARKIGIDPIEIRRRNLNRSEDLPFTNPFGMPIDDISPYECLEHLLEHFDVDAFRREQAEARKQGRYLGIGVCAYIEPTGAGAGAISVLTSDVADIRIEPTGQVTAILSTHSQGHGTQTTMAQVIAERLGVPFETVSVYEDDSSRGGSGSGASGSRQAVAGGGACIRCSDLLMEKVRMLGGHLLEAPAERIVVQEGVVQSLDDVEKSMLLRELAEIAYGEPARWPAGMQGGLEAHYRYMPPPLTLTSAAHLCIVEIDSDTGFVKIQRWIACEDVGVMINPAIVEGQVAGGLAQAIGTVLMEEVAFDDRGNPVTVTYKDYHLPAITDIPDFEYLHLNRPSKAEGGFRGVGEGGCIIGPPTLVNAIADALLPFGSIEVDLPLTPTKILSVIEGRSMRGDAAPPPVAPDVTGATLGATQLVDSLAGEFPVREVIDPPPESGPASAPSAKIDGAWAMTLASPVGPQPMTGHFKTEGSQLTGRLDSDQGSMEFSGSVEGTRAKFDMKVTKPMPITLKYDLEFSGDQLSGTCKMGMFGKSKVTGDRIKD